jgi:hypothetical protein
MNSIRIGHSLCLTGLIVFALMGCDRPDAPGCLMRAGDDVEIVESFNEAPLRLKLYDHMNVVLEPWDSASIELVWSGPEHVLAHRWSAWEGEVLELGHEDRCQWMRDLGVNVGLTVRTPIIPEIALYGQGRFDAALEDSTMAVTIDAWAYAGYLTVACELDSLTIRLHAGACSAVAEGTAGTVSLFASGLSAVDAGALRAERAFINQSAHPPLHFQATEYAYVELNSHGNVVGQLPEPLEYEVVRNGSGDLIWED